MTSPIQKWLPFQSSPGRVAHSCQRWDRQPPPQLTRRQTSPFHPLLFRCPWQHVSCSSACWFWQSLKDIAGRQPSRAATCTVSTSVGKSGLGESCRLESTDNLSQESSQAVSFLLPAFNVTVRSDRHGTCQGSHVAQACVGHCESSAFPSRYSVLVASGYRHNITSVSQCCTISSLKKVKVWLNCVGNQRGELEIFTARACQCDMCRLSRY
ncbi:glycoprotein hormone alpha-2 isoform X2 [Mesocricetus auratus]|uniref:Glycoprotein hormone alpha-2 isoform X2 n=1 Tax=Mesocricetus auratus TaxID=10036 RepID=A0ABM2XQI1_MESAU|nr:glycoprotein hormone alpha-2 isoform X2 [Mesocricetus auratus]